MKPGDVRLARLAADSVSRTARERVEVAQRIGEKRTAAALNSAVRPRSMAGTLRSGGIALLVAPEPITTIAGAAMIGVSVYAKGRDPLNTSSVVHEARKILEDLRL